MIVQVPPDLAIELWPQLAPMFARVTKHTRGCYEPVDILKEVIAGQQVLWVAWDGNPERRIDAVMTTSIITYPRRKTCRVLFIAGDKLASWKDDFIMLIERYAADQGATAMEGCFRRGWARVAGYREHGVALWKDLAA